jgi:hypothetical protein
MKGQRYKSHKLPSVNVVTRCFGFPHAQELGIMMIIRTRKNVENHDETVKYPSCVYFRETKSHASTETPFKKRLKQLVLPSWEELHDTIRTSLLLESSLPPQIGKRKAMREQWRICTVNYCALVTLKLSSILSSPPTMVRSTRMTECITYHEPRLIHTGTTPCGGSIKPPS